jgi:LacI family transcriptional regulator
MINDRKAAYDAVTYLISKGHKKFCHLEVRICPKFIDRFRYKKALEDNIPYDSSLVYLCDNNTDFEDG